MELNKKEFKEAVMRIATAIPKKSIIQNLCNILFESKDGVVTLTGSDSNHICHTNFKVEGAENVSFTVNCEKLKKALAMRGEKIAISYVSEPNEKIVVGNGVTSVELDCLPVSDYPVFNKPQTTNTRKVSARKFVDIVNKVKFSASADTSRKALTGVYANFTDSEMQIFCTDGKRIAYGSEPCSELISNEAFGFNLPMKSVEIINNLNITATQNEDKTWNEPEVTINYSGTTVEFVQDGFCTVSKLIDGNPPVDAILGMINGGKVFQEPECVFKADTNIMADIVKFVSSLSAQDSSVKISKTGNKLYFQSKGVNQSVEDQMEVEDVKPLDVSVTCNINYILAPLTNFATESVTFEMVGESVSPFFIVADNFKYLLMPLKSNQ